ncbi:MAG: hypothetical protein CML45_03715 [Rhodobacteraceae bacterium]|nr:hypothetical protein [Paracoccaceae bacterium]|tara:strand:+ start:14945 stop:15205 length:261 start_codon:yes stop_codon:yes gene_type:complete
MPKYFYTCADCGSEISFYHSMSEKMTDCTLCGCADSLIKKPSNFSLNKQKKEKKVGDLVKESIEDFRQELSQEKEKVRNELYEPNE